MALHLNLYHEIQKEKIAASRDPLKFALYALIAIAALLAVNYFWQLGVMSSISNEYNRKKADFDALEPKAAAATKREAEVAATLKSSEALVKAIEGRFYCAPLIDSLTKIVPKQIQITRLNAEIQGDDVKKVLLTIDGIAAGAEPRKIAEDFRTAVADDAGKKYKEVSANFRSLDDSTESVTYEGQKWPSALFSIRVQLSSGEAAATPAPVRRKR